MPLTRRIKAIIGCDQGDVGKNRVRLFAEWSRFESTTKKLAPEPWRPRSGFDSRAATPPWSSTKPMRNRRCSSRGQTPALQAGPKRIRGQSWLSGSGSASTLSSSLAPCTYRRAQAPRQGEGPRWETTQADEAEQIQINESRDRGPGRRLGLFSANQFIV
jgi:hypothetical protein